jgi:hypothetical protein
MVGISLEGEKNPAFPWRGSIGRPDKLKALKNGVFRRSAEWEQNCCYPARTMQTGVETGYQGSYSPLIDRFAKKCRNVVLVFVIREETSLLPG